MWRRTYVQTYVHKYVRTDVQTKSGKPHVGRPLGSGKNNRKELFVQYNWVLILFFLTKAKSVCGFHWEKGKQVNSVNPMVNNLCCANSRINQLNKFQFYIVSKKLFFLSAS